VKALSVSSLLFWKAGWLRNLPSHSLPEPDGLDAFAAERAANAPAHEDRASSRRRYRWTVAILAVVALIEAPVAGLLIYEWSRQDAAANALLPQRPGIQPAAPLAAPPVVPATIDSLAAVPVPAVSAAPARAAIEQPERAAAPLAVGGWVSLKTPMPMQVFEEGRLIGSTEVDRIMLPVGTRRLEIVSEVLGYRARHEVAIRAGQTSTLRLDMPTGILALNAQPWAEVWIDGERVGETPIGNLTRPIGPHEVVFKHPDLGEKKTTVIVTLKEPARVSVDLRSKS
jgi:hypothetical protein